MLSIQNSVLRMERTQTPIFSFVPKQSFFQEPTREKKIKQITAEIQNRLDELQEIFSLCAKSAYEKAGENYTKGLLIGGMNCEKDGNRLQAQAAKFSDVISAFNCGSMNVSDRAINDIYNHFMSDDLIEIDAYVN